MGIIKLNRSANKAPETMQEEVQAPAANAAQPAKQEKRWQDPAILKEYSEKTDAQSRHFKLNNGTAKSIIGASPVNYYDETSQQWKSIDNSFTETAEAFETKDGKYKTQIYKPEQAKKVRLASGNIGLSWEYLGKPAQTAVQTLSTAEQSAQPQTVLDVKPAQEGVLQNTDGAAVYENADKDTDIEYIVHGGGVKENIIIKERAEEYKYLFALNTEGLKMRLSDDNGSLELYTESAGENGETVTKTEATIPAPFMFDANGAVSDSVYFELEPQQDGRYVFSVVADAEWINEEGRAFPVTVDPQIVTGDSGYVSKLVQYRNKYTSSSGGSYYSSWYTTSSSYIKVLRNTSREYKTTLTVNKSGLPKLDYPVSAARMILTPYKVLQQGSCYVGGSIINVSSGKIKVNILGQYIVGTNSFNITIEPVSSSYINAEFYATGTNGPVLEVEYLINGKKKVFVQPFTLVGGLAGQYDITTGDASIAFEDVPASDSVLGLGISHVYKKSAEEHSVGKNFRLSLHETLSKTGAAALNADYVYTDATGMKHGFKDTYYYLDASGDKISVNKSLVSVDLDGKLTYTTGDETFEVKKEQRTKSGLTAVTVKDGFINNEYIDERNENVIQAEQKLKQLQEQELSCRQTILQCEIQELSNKVQAANNKVEQYKKDNDYEFYEDQYNSILKKAEEFSKAETEYLMAHYPEDNKTQQVLTPALASECEAYIMSQTITNASQFQTARGYVFNGLVNGTYTDNDANENSQVRTVFNYHYTNRMNYYKRKLQNILDGAESQTYENETLKDYVFLAPKEIVNKQNLLLNGDESMTGAKMQAEEKLEEVQKQIVQAQYEYDMYVRQMPLNYITDGKIVKGFNEAGNLVVVFDKYENMLTVEYDDSGKIVNVYDGEDKQIAFEYRPDGLLGSITDTRGRRTEYDYDDGKLISVKKPGGKELALGYDPSNPDNLISVTTSDKMRSELQYTNGLLSKVITKSLVSGIAHGEEPATADVKISECSFSFGDNLTILTDDKGNKKYYKIDDLGDVYEYYAEENGLVIAAEKYDYVPGESNTQGKDDVYTSSPSLMYKKSFAEFVPDFENGDFIKTVLDEFNNPETVTTNERALSTGTTTQTTVNYTYKDDHKCIKEETIVTIKEGTSVLDKYTQITAYNYNAAGNVVRKENYIVGEEYTTGKSIEETEYDANGNAVRSFSYNSLDSSSKFYTESEVAENGQTVADYDETGENKTEYEYISGTNVVREEKMPNGSKFAYGYDENDTVTSISQSTEEGEENSTHTRYTCGEVTELVSGNNVVQYAYDAKRRLSKVYLNDLEKAYLQNTYTDDTTEEGIAVTVDKCVSVNAKNESVSSYTDKQGKLRRITTSAGAKIDYGYNAKGETTSVTDGVSGNTEAYEYDNDYDRLKNYTRNEGKPSEYTETYAYDKYGQVSSVAQSGAATRTYSYAYKETAAHDLASIGTGTYKFLPQTDKLGRNAGREITESDVKLAAEYIYYRKVGDHATNMPSAVYYGKKSGDKFPIAENIKYKYDKMGNICRIDENGAPVVWYKYDALNRLVREDNKSFGKTWLYSYDNKGNILCKRETSFTLKENAEESEFTSVQYEYDGDKLLSYGTEECVYDEIGNPKTYRGKSVQWANGRQMVNYSGTAFTYDGLGRRLSKGNITYTYDSNGRVIKQSNGIEFLYDNSGVAGIVYNNVTYLYRKDAQGNICALIDSNGNVVVEYKYDAWGNHSVQDANGADINNAAHIGSINPFRYRGYYYDTETGLYYLKSRYYDPETGRFITIDDIAILDTTRDYPNGLNLYTYCFNDPINASDDEGNIPNWLKWLLGGLAFVGAVALTVLSGGSLTPIFLGMGASIIGGGLIQGTVTAINGGSFWQGFANGAADGALWGGIFALGGAVVRTARILKNGVVIGESMSRVEAAAKQVGALTYKAPGKNIVKIFGRTKAFEINKALNKAWIKRMTRWGVKIYDIGLDLTRISRSPFYAIEAAVTAGYWNLIKMLF